jgi:hypothetical protein
MHSEPTHTAAEPNTEMNERLSVVLGAPRRQYALSVLASGSGRPMVFEDLALAVTAFEHLERNEPVPDEPTNSVEISLYHCHLPKLAAAGLVEDDYADGKVELTREGVNCAAVLGVGQGRF